MNLLEKPLEDNAFGLWLLKQKKPYMRCLVATIMLYTGRTSGFKISHVDQIHFAIKKLRGKWKEHSLADMAWHEYLKTLQ